MDGRTRITLASLAPKGMINSIQERDSPDFNYLDRANMHAIRIPRGKHAPTTSSSLLSSIPPLLHLVDQGLLAKLVLFQDREHT